MEKYIIPFLVITAITGLVGFAGLNFKGIEIIRVLFLIFADLLIISVLAKLFFLNRKMRLERIKK
ncbi:hypothetical protein BH23BAC2_BH23BAC2_00900 [soil metagenome]